MARAAKKKEPKKAKDIKLRQPDRSAPTDKTLLDFAQGQNLFEAAERRQRELAGKDPDKESDHGGDDEESPISLGLERFLEAFLWTVSLAMLHFTLDVLVYRQYGKEFSWNIIILRAARAWILFFVLFWPLHPHRAIVGSHFGLAPKHQEVARRIIFSGMSVVSGCYLIHITNTYGYLYVMKQAPPLVCLWLWAIIELDLPSAMSSENTQLILAKRPTTNIDLNETFQVRTGPAPDASSLSEGQVLAETIYVMLEPVMRRWIDGLIFPIHPGQLMLGPTVLRAVASRDPAVKPGDLGISMAGGWTTYAVISDIASNWDPIDVSALAVSGGKLPQGVSVTDYTGFLGFTGLTGYFGVAKLGPPKPGDTYVVSVAAGATGSIAAQIAKILGARVVGIAGSEEKCSWLTDELGLDAAVNYKDPEFETKFAKAVEGGIDFYFDNAGGRILELAVEHLKHNSRIILCGNVSVYNDPTASGIRDLMPLAVKSITLSGLSIFAYVKEFPAAREQLIRWFSEGKLKRSETLVKGTLEDAPRVLTELFDGKNTGKMLLQIKDLDA